MSGIASRIDVPVYVFAVASPLDAPGLSGVACGPTRSGRLAGTSPTWPVDRRRAVRVQQRKPAEASLAAREVVTELRHQYLIAFEPGSQPGWHPLEVRMRDRKLTVRARSGYFAAQPRLGS